MIPIKQTLYKAGFIVSLVFVIVLGRYLWGCLHGPEVKIPLTAISQVVPPPPIFESDEVQAAVLDSTGSFTELISIPVDNAEDVHEVVTVPSGGGVFAVEKEKDTWFPEFKEPVSRVAAIGADGSKAVTVVRSRSLLEVKPKISVGVSYSGNLRSSIGLELARIGPTHIGAGVHWRPGERLNVGPEVGILLRDHLSLSVGYDAIGSGNPNVSLRYRF